MRPISGACTAFIPTLRSHGCMAIGALLTGPTGGSTLTSTRKRRRRRLSESASFSSDDRLPRRGGSTSAVVVRATQYSEGGALVVPRRRDRVRSSAGQRSVFEYDHSAHHRVA